jgi:small subunit ribosomal protein S4
MGDPKKRRKLYSTPSHPWNKERIEEEKALIKEYGLKNKKEIWRHDSFLKDLSRRAKSLVTLKTKQDEIEKKRLLEKVKALGLAGENVDLGDILALTLRDILERRLQTQVYKKGLARSMKQSRQFITHRHVLVGANKMTIPSYLVTLSDEAQLIFTENSALSNAEHPERVSLESKEAPKVKNE